MAESAYLKASKSYIRTGVPFQLITTNELISLANKTQSSESKFIDAIVNFKSQQSQLF